MREKAPSKKLLKRTLFIFRPNFLTSLFQSPNKVLENEISEY